MKIERKRVELVDTLSYTLSGSTFKVYNSNTYEIEEVQHTFERYDGVKSIYQDLERYIVTIKSRVGYYRAFWVNIDREVREGIADPYGFTVEIMHSKNSYGNEYNFIRENLCYELPEVIKRVCENNRLKVYTSDSETSIKLFFNASTQEHFNENCKKMSNLIKEIIAEFNSIAVKNLEQHDKKQQQALDYFKVRMSETQEEPKTVTLEIGGNRINLNRTEITELKRQLATLN